MTSLAVALEIERLATATARYEAMLHWIANDLAAAKIAAGVIDASIDRQRQHLPEPRA